MQRLMIGLCLLTLTSEAWAQTCVVEDPTGTPLNVRSAPNGSIIGALHNGALVQILDTMSDARGRPWAYIAPLGAGNRGWVYDRYLHCGQ
jgi:uncharacterized protein YraI